MKKSSTVSAYSRLQGHKAGVTCLACNDNVLASGSDDKTVRLFDLRSNKCSKAILLESFKEAVIGAVAFAVTDDNILYCCSGRNLYSVDIRNEQVLLREALFSVEDVIDEEISCISLNSSYIVVGDDSGSIGVIDAERNVRMLPNIHTTIVGCVSFHPKYPFELNTGGFDCQLKCVDIITGKTRLNHNFSRSPSAAGQTFNPPFVHSLAHFSRGRGVCCGLGDGAVTILDSCDFTVVASAPEAHSGMCSSVYADTNGSFILSSGIDRRVRCWRFDPCSLSYLFMAEDSSYTDIRKKKLKAPKGERSMKNESQIEGPFVGSLAHVWDLDHGEKVNVVAGKKRIDDSPPDNFFVGDTSPVISVYKTDWM